VRRLSKSKLDSNEQNGGLTMANEVRLIDANALVRDHGDDVTSWDRPYAVKISSIEAAPTIDPESLRPKGRWTENRRVGFSDAIEDDVYWFTYTCSECGGEVMNDYHYCPNCGAKMEG
jgi:hypothetical protein